MNRDQERSDVFGVERLASGFGGRVCFCCSIDHQRRAVSGTRDEIAAYARRLRDQLGACRGGFIAYIEEYASLGMSERNYQWICEAFGALNWAVSIHGRARRPPWPPRGTIPRTASGYHGNAGSRGSPFAHSRALPPGGCGRRA